MARIVLLTWGSHGDVLPFVALARALLAAGHQVRLGAQPHHAGFVRQHGIRFQPLGSQTSADRYQQLMARLIDEANPRKQLQRLLQEMLLSDLDAHYRDALAAVQADDADLVVAHALQLAGMAAAESLGKPCVTVSLNPLGIGAAEGQGISGHGQGGSRNLGRMLADAIWGEDFHLFRARHGLPPIASVSGYPYSRDLNLLAVSPALLADSDLNSDADADADSASASASGSASNSNSNSNPDAAACAPQRRITGFWRLPEPDASDASAWKAWTPSPELEAFLAAPGKPVVFSFGSMGGRVEELNAIVGDAVRQLGCRAILQGGWAGLGMNMNTNTDTDTNTRSEAGQDILCVDYVPHAYLFFHASCVVHHGGAGTTAAALHVGTPSVIVWHMLDQPYWGNRLARLELGPPPLSRLGLQAGQLSERIRIALDTPLYAENCRHMARQLEVEQGVIRAMEAIALLSGW